MLPGAHLPYCTIGLIFEMSTPPPLTLSPWDVIAKRLSSSPLTLIKPCVCVRVMSSTPVGVKLSLW